MNKNVLLSMQLKASSSALALILAAAPGSTLAAGGHGSAKAHHLSARSSTSPAGKHRASAASEVAESAVAPAYGRAGNKTLVNSGDLLKGRVSATQSPFLDGKVESIPSGTKVDLTLMAHLNSEVSQKGDEILARIAVDVKNGQRVYLPHGWYIRGVVTDVAEQRRLGRDGYVEIEFDSLISPDGNYELKFPAKLSTRDNTVKALAKTLVEDAGYVTLGAAGGAILSTQLTGIPVAILTQGYSVAIGAGVGAGIGAIGALKRKGKIASFYPGDELKLTIAEPLTIPGFNPEFLAAATPGKKLDNLNIFVNRARFKKDPFGDDRARLLTLEVKVDNQSDKEYSLFDLAVVSDHNQRYYPSLLTGLNTWKKKVAPHSAQEATLSFSVDSPKCKYWLVVLDRTNRDELTRVPIN